jgi:hypothetical protein
MSDFDSAKPRLLCEPWDGSQGAAFLQRFAPDFEGALHTVQDRFASLYDHLHELDPGSTNNPHPGTAPHGRGAQATPADDKYLESERAYNLRSRKLYGLIRQHVTDPAIRQEIDALAIKSGIEAWKIVKAQGTPPRTGLTNIDDDSAWASLRLSDVGIDERTIVKIVAKINQMNSEREAGRQFSEDERRLKLLSLISFPAHLVAKAQEELQRPSYKTNGNPSFSLTHKAFDELWRHAFRNGMIKAQAPPQRS